MLDAASNLVERAKTRVRGMRPDKKTAVMVVGITILAVMAWGVYPNNANAQSFSANIFGKTFDILGTAGMVWLVLYVLRGILSYALGLVSGFLDFGFALNTAINPGQITVVQNGWTYLRDLANGIFILLVLWIAITIIFDMEGLGGKKFLVRVIMVALLINFSLAMVSTVFAFGNELAKPFQKAMGAYPECTRDEQGVEKCGPPKATISALIVQNSRIHTALDVIADQGALEQTQAEVKKLGVPTATTEPISFGGIPEYFGAPQTAHAIAPILAGILIQIGLSAVYTTAIAVLGTLAVKYGLAQQAMMVIVNLAIADGFLFLTILAMATAAIILLLRLVAMVFLGVFAPVAFLGLAFPKYGNSFWSRWLDNLLRWTFTAPIFYFLLYLSLLMLQSNTVGNERLINGAPLPGNFFIMLNLVLFLVFLWAAVYMTRKTAGHFAEVALGLGRKAVGFGLGAVTGFAARGALSATRRGAPTIEKVLEGAGRMGALKPLRTPFRKIMADQRKQVADETTRLKGLGLTPDQLVQEHNSSLNAATKVAAGQLLAEKGKYDLLEGRSQRTLELAAQYGADPVMSILMTNPSLATPALLKRIDPASTAATPADAWSEVLKKVNPSGAEKMSDKAFDDPVLVAAMWRQFEPEHIKRIARSDRPHLIQKMVTQLNANPAVASSINERMRQYLSSTAARELGLTVPIVGARPSLVITPGVVPTWTAGTPNTFTPRMRGGVGTIVWRFGAGFAPPTWLTIHAGTGTITADATAPSGTTLSVPIEAEDGTGSTSAPQTFLIRIS